AGCWSAPKATWRTASARPRLGARASSSTWAITARCSSATAARPPSSASRAASTTCGPRAVSSTRRRSGEARAAGGEGAMTTEEEPARAAFYNDPKVRGIFYQLVLFALVVWLGYGSAVMARDTLRGARIGTGFGFLDNTAGFSISQTLISYPESDSYGRVLVVGLLNPLLIAVIGIVLTSILGFLVGLARLS